ncbi:alpha/beta fold hydrolase [Pseudomonas sp.]|uniref:alpha/beta fold hydrolase n=1 Tax=Pseudomonas sp. TaxID=306 RepID=UPI0025DE59BE|nr:MULTISPECIES: alpha/beta hydrolase [unclassified Pseudomonas]
MSASHGASAKPNVPDAYAWDALVDDYLAVLGRYAGERNVLVAHSFGTGLTLSALVRLHAQPQPQPPRVQAALLLGTLLTRPEFKHGLLSLPAWVLRLIRPWLARRFRERAWHPLANLGLIAYEEKLTENNELYVFKALLSQARWPTLAQLSLLDLPVSVLAGDCDGLTPADGGRALAQHLPNAGFEVLPECGHQLMLEKPQVVLAAIRALLTLDDSASSI